MSLVEP